MEKELKRHLRIQCMEADGRATSPASHPSRMRATNPYNILPSTTKGLLHRGGGHRRRRAGHGDACGWVDDGDGVATAGGRGLVKF